jgi:hypothetical protein
MAVPIAPVLDAPPLRRYGLPEYVIGASPAAAAHFVQELGGSFHTRLVSVFCRLVTDATVANRTVLVEYRSDDDSRFAVNGAAVTQAASTTTDWHFDSFRDEAAWLVDDTVLAPLSPLLLPPTFDFRIFVDNVQAADQLSRVRFVWERFYSDVALDPDY